MNASRSLKFVVLLIISIVGLMSVSVTSAQETTPAPDEPGTVPQVMSDEDAQLFAERFDAVFNGPSLDIIDEIFAPDYVGHLPLSPDLDREGLKAYIASFYAAISDLTQQTQEVIIGEDRLVLRVNYTGSHDGPLFGVPATGNEVTFSGVGIFRFDDNGLVAENWAVIDVVGLLAQVGAFPPAQ